MNLQKFLRNYIGEIADFAENNTILTLDGTYSGSADFIMYISEVEEDYLIIGSDLSRQRILIPFSTIKKIFF